MPAPSVRNHLAELIDVVLPTVSGRPNRVIRVEDDVVLASTDRSPTGEPVPLADIQAAADRVFDGEEVPINTASVGLHSAFVGAVLRSMSMAGVDVLQRPPRARLVKVSSPPDPEWEFEELVLSLNQYLKTGTHVEPSDPEIVALSELLGCLPLREDDVDRSPDAILRMLQRWRDIDLYYEEELVPPLLGTPREKEVWERFITEQEDNDLEAAVAAIKALADEPAATLLPVDDEAEAIEGRLLFRQHRARERDPEITRLKKASVMDNSGGSRAKSATSISRQHTGRGGVH